MSQLQQGWGKSKLGEFVKLKNGFAFKSKDYVDVGENTVPVVRISDIQNGKASTETASHIYNSKTDAKFLIRKGDLLIAMSGATTGKTGVFNSDEEAYQNQRVGNLKLVDEESNCPRYRNYLIQSLQQDILKKAYGAAQPNISAKDLAEIEVFIAPYNDQKRIADKLDLVLAKVEAAQARLDKIPTILKRFRQSVLAAATSGELTKDWREQNEHKIESWQKKSIEELTVKAFDGPFGSKLKTIDYTDKGIKVARLENIGHMHFKTEKETYVSDQKFKELEKHELLGDDVLFSSFVDEEIRVCKFSASYGKHINKADCFCLRPDISKIIPDLLVYKLASRSTYEVAKEQVHGATRPRINLRFLKSLQLSVPCIEEQVVLVAKIDALFGYAKTVENQYKIAKARLDKLTQSILARAFSGKLFSSISNDEREAVVVKTQSSQPNQTKTRV